MYLQIMLPQLHRLNAIASLQLQTVTILKAELTLSKNGQQIE
jgi:hypothetical protein